MPKKYKKIEITKINAEIKRKKEIAKIKAKTKGGFTSLIEQRFEIIKDCYECGLDLGRKLYYSKRINTAPNRSKLYYKHPNVYWDIHTSAHNKKYDY